VEEVGTSTAANYAGAVKSINQKLTITRKKSEGYDPMVLGSTRSPKGHKQEDSSIKSRFSSAYRKDLYSRRKGSKDMS